MTDNLDDRSRAAAKKVVHPEFAGRLESACDGNPDVPPLNHGRLGWFVEQLTKHNVDVTLETVRKWFAGETRPRHRAMTALAQVLKTDELWLSNGKTPEFSDRQQRVHNMVAGGAVNVVAGFIQIDGWHPAFPIDGDQEAAANAIHLYAIIRGAKYSFHIAPAIGTDEAHFVVPHEARNAMILGVVPGAPFSVRVFELDWDTVMKIGTRKSNGYYVPVSGPNWREIKSFADRI